MTITNKAILLAAALATAAAPVCTLAHDEVVIGRTAANRLALHIHVPTPFILAESPFSEFPGWTGIEPAIISNSVNDPEEDMFTLSATANIKLVFVGADADARLLSDDGTHWMTPGETFQFGSPFFHIHPIWNLQPGAGEGQHEIRLFLRDTTGQHLDSEVYTFTFARDCPSDLNRDGFIDFADYLEFLNYYEAGDSTVDFNNDGFVDFADYLEFLNLYDAGC